MDKVHVHCVCGAAYAWSTEHANCGFKCTCGRFMRLPGQAPSHDITVEPHEDTAPQRRVCQVCLALLPVDDVVCIHCGFNFAEGRRVHVHKDRVKDERELALEAEARRDNKRRLIASIVLGSLAWVWMILARPMMDDATIFAALGISLGWLVVGTGIMLISMHLASRWIDVQLDDLLPLAVKLAAVFFVVHVVRVQAFQTVGLAEIYQNMDSSNVVGGMGTAIYIVMSLIICGVVVPTIIMLVLFQYLFGMSMLDGITAWLFCFLTNTGITLCLKLGGWPG